MGKNRSNIYCESCKKYHRQGVHIEKVVDPLIKGEPDAIMRLMRKATRNMYISRDMLGDAKEFKESDIVKEVDTNDDAGRNSEENK